MVRELVEPAVRDRGLHLYDVEHDGGVLRVLVEGPDGVDLDGLADLTRTVSLLLDEHDPVPGRYTLEVSSPGLERRLRRARALRGRHRRAGHGQRRCRASRATRRVRGVVRAADDDGVEILAEGAGEPRRLALRRDHPGAHRLRVARG
ncbi:MAG: ribosome maturation factor RimP [Acidimicrobiia bacterium]|nr:ribosome maturation factor RimP [Acidimicrobiia bacterium]